MDLRPIHKVKRTGKPYKLGKEKKEMRSVNQMRRKTSELIRIRRKNIYKKTYQTKKVDPGTRKAFLKKEKYAKRSKKKEEFQCGSV